MNIVTVTFFEEEMIELIDKINFMVDTKEQQKLIDELKTMLLLEG